MAVPERVTADARSSYRRILRSSAVIGGVSIINVAVGLLRAKVIALLLGPTGIGLLGVLISIFDLARSVAGLGVSESGIRRLSETSSSNDADGFARTATTLRLLAGALGAAACLSLVVLSGVLAQVTFGSSQYQIPIALVGVAVGLRVVSDAYGSTLQSLRRIGDLARVNLYGGLLGTAAGLAAVWAFGTVGVALVLVGISAAALLWTQTYLRRVHLAKVRMNWAEHRNEALGLINLGIAFMAAGLMMMGAMYLVRLIITRNAGLEAAGLYQAAWSLGTLYITVLLHAMGTDFYPRLSALAADDQACNRLINEQAHVSVLLAGPGVIATLVLAEPALGLLYSSRFVDGADTLRWICLGVSLRVLCWPVGYVVIAKQRRSLFVALDVGWFTVFIVGAWVLVQRMDMLGAGIAFFLSYLAHAVVVLWVARRLTGFTLSRAVVTTSGAFGAALALVSLAAFALPPRSAQALGAGVAILAVLGALFGVSRLTDEALLPGGIRRLVRTLGRETSGKRDRDE